MQPTSTRDKLQTQKGGLFVRLDIGRGPKSCYSASAYILPFSICVEVHASCYLSAQAKVARFELQTFHWSLQYIENRRQAKCLEINRERFDAKYAEY